MKKNMHFNILLLLLLVEAMTVHAFAQILVGQPQRNISFEEYLNSVGKNNLNYLAEKLNVSIADAEAMAAKVFPDPELGFEAGNETFSLGLSYSLELGNKRGARIKLARSQAAFEKLMIEQGFQDLRAEAANFFLEAILQKELLKVQRSSYEYMLQLSQSDSLRYAVGEITENDARQSKLEAVTLLNTVYGQEAAYQSSLVMLNKQMGVTADTLHIPFGNWEELNREFMLSELIKVGLDNRIDLLAAQKSTEVTEAWFCHEAEKKKVAQLKAGILEDSQKVLEGMVYKYKRGEINILDVLVAQRTYNEVQQEYLETMKGYVASLVELEKTCGIWDIRF